MLAVRPARPGEAAGLTALCLRSKAHWGYDAEFMRLSALTLKVHETDIAAGRVLVATDASGRPGGVACVQGHAGEVELADMFVDPPAIGSVSLELDVLQPAVDPPHPPDVVALDHVAGVRIDAQRPARALKTQSGERLHQRGAGDHGG